MASIRQNTFYQNKKQETTEIEHVSALGRRLQLERLWVMTVQFLAEVVFTAHGELYYDHPQLLKLKMASKSRNIIYENKKQETTEIVRRAEDMDEEEPKAPVHYATVGSLREVLGPGGDVAWFKRWRGQRRRLSQCPEEEDDEASTSSETSAVRQSRGPLPPPAPLARPGASPHYDRRFFDSSLVEMKSPAASTATLVDSDSSQDIWLPRAEPDVTPTRKRRLERLWVITVRLLAVVAFTAHGELYCDHPQSLKLKTASKRRNTFYENKKQETTCNLPPFCEKYLNLI
ncbi:hypothetical protein AAG570_004947 [Ranatra chinensis]|uniref:Uncharacterized protein n=1 Tax=Ranatra chinensis TaxID=642074 RepID=A0ABD0YKT4_9HEMI